MQKVLDIHTPASTILTNNKQQTTNNKQQTTNNKQQTTNNKGGIASFLNTNNSIYRFSHKSLYWYDFSRNDIGFLYQFWRRKQYG
jgi:hypothetical protein